MERTLVLIKPDAITRSHCAVAMINAIRSLPDSTVLFFKRVTVPEPLARLHYFEHDGKPFFPGLIRMITAPCGVGLFVLEGKDIVRRIRALVGPTNVTNARSNAPDTLRGTYGTFAGLNTAHASDSPANGEREVNLWVSALGLTLNKEEAAKEMDKFVEEHKDAKFTPGKVATLALKLKEVNEELKKAIQEESDLGEDDVNYLMKLIANVL